ncbi:MAG: helix-turn-helix domain-containing protein [Minisyncoccia bacterium]
METARKNIGSAIAEIRKEQGLTHDDIAERAIVTIEDMRNIEEGVLSPDQKTLDSIAKILRVSSKEITDRAASILTVIKKIA